MDSILQHLENRIDPTHLKQRLGIEAEAEIKSDHINITPHHGLTLLHPENWYSIHRLLKFGMSITRLYQRGQRNALNIQLQHSNIHIPNLPAAFDGYKILHITDLHLDMHADFPQALCTRVSGLDYDLCVLTGDYRYQTRGPFDAALKGLEQLRQHINGDIYAVLGNHDSIRMVPEMENMGMNVLLNEAICLEREQDKLYLAGIDDPHYFRTDNLERACVDIPDSATSILLAHSPEIYRQAAHSGFDLMLCGHTHGGQIRLPGNIPLYYNASCPRRLCSGLWQHKNLQGYTSLGAGSSIIDVRFNCLPEVVIHTLQPAT